MSAKFPLGPEGGQGVKTIPGKLLMVIGVLVSYRHSSIKMLQNLSSAAVVICPLRVNHFSPKSLNLKGNKVE